jgi:hypothetical protein
VTIARAKDYMVPQFHQGGSSGVPAVPATILMSAPMEDDLKILKEKYREFQS